VVACELKLTTADRESNRRSRNGRPLVRRFGGDDVGGTALRRPSRQAAASAERLPLIEPNGPICQIQRLVTVQRWQNCMLQYAQLPKGGETKTAPVSGLH